MNNTIAEALKSNEIALEKGLSWIKSQLKASSIDLPSRTVRYSE